MSKRRTFTPEFKARVVLEELTGVNDPMAPLAVGLRSTYWLTYSSTVTLALIFSDIACAIGRAPSGLRQTHSPLSCPTP